MVISPMTAGFLWQLNLNNQTTDLIGVRADVWLPLGG